jgi:hypothetical protein
MRKFPSFRKAKPASCSANDAPKPGIPGMVSSAEMAFFTESAARYAGQEGAIVDLGCWLGSTSIALARGILSRRSEAVTPPEKVFGFDLFRWEPWMPAHIPYCEYQAGENFLPEARRIVRDHGGGAVELVQADLGLYEWQGGPIKLLLVDAMKNATLAVQIPRSFFSSLVVGSLLIHQDFKHYYTSWIHVLQYRLRQYFRFYQSVPSGTVAFETIAPIPREALLRATEYAIPDGEIDASFQHSLQLVMPDERANIAAAHVMHYVHLERKERARFIVELYRREGLSEKGEFPDALNLLGQT